MKTSGDWCPCDDDDLNAKAILLHASPGDLILWDSRTIHGGLVGTGKVAALSDANGSEPIELARLSVTVAMTPRQWASEQVQKLRSRGFSRGENFNHSPHEAGTSTGTLLAKPRKGFQPIKLTAEQRALL